MLLPAGINLSTLMWRTHHLCGLLCVRGSASTSPSNNTNTITSGASTSIGGINDTE